MLGRFALSRTSVLGTLSCQKWAQHARPVYLNLAVFCDFSILPNSLCQAGHGGRGLTNPSVQFCVERQCFGDCGSQVDEITDHFKLMIGDY